MASVAVYNMEGNEVGTMDLNDAVFGVKVNEHLVHMAVVQYLADRRQGTQKAKTRGEVSGGGRKPWKQKGTGQARQGSRRAPQWKGGGVVFAPVPRDYSFKLNKKEKRAALKSALTDKVQRNKLIVLDELKMDAVKTKDFKKILDNLKVEKALVVLGSVEQAEYAKPKKSSKYQKKDTKRKIEIKNSPEREVQQRVILSARNLPTVETTCVTVIVVQKDGVEVERRVGSTINVYDIMKYDSLVVTKSAIANIEEVYA